MPVGFFHESRLITGPQIGALPQCGKCGLFKKCESPKMEYRGKGRAKILIVGEAPGRTEDERGRPFVGTSGQLLRDTFHKFGIDVSQDCWVTNAIICRPAKNKPPTPKEIKFCLPNLKRTIEETKPNVIIPLGSAAVRAVLTGIWHERIDEIGRWVGWNIPCRKTNAWICPTWHPKFIIRENEKRNPVADLWWKRHLKAAIKLSGGCPWPEGPPDYEKQIQRIYDPAEAARIIRTTMLLGPRPASFDYETNMLKPDGKDARIVSCSICWEGVKTIAFPWQGEAIEATYEFLESDAPKIGGNIKFEERWTLAMLGIRVRNWLRDVMQNAHILDNRKGITSVKFQSFVRLGIGDYTKHIKPFLEAKTSTTPNRIHEIDLKDLLLYNGLDSLLEYKIDELQEIERKKHEKLYRMRSED